VWKLHMMSSVIWTCQNNLDFSLCVMPSISYMVKILENDLVRSYKKRSKVCHY